MLVKIVYINSIAQDNLEAFVLMTTEKIFFKQNQVSNNYRSSSSKKQITSQTIHFKRKLMILTVW